MAAAFTLTEDYAEAELERIPAPWDAQAGHLVHSGSKDRAGGECAMDCGSVAAGVEQDAYATGGVRLAQQTALS